MLISYHSFKRFNQGFSMSAMISIKHLAFSYPEAPNKLVLSIDNLVVNRGEHLFLYGPSGSGKSTLLNLITGLTDATSGSIEVLEQNWNALKGKKRDQFRAAHIGFVFQQLNLIPYLTVLDNILLADFFVPKNKAPNVPDMKAKAAYLLEALQLPISILGQKASQLSVGQQQRVAIARALINDPELLIADEPTSALDHDSRDAFVKLLFELAEQHQTTLVFVSHDQTLAIHFPRKVDLLAINQNPSNSEARPEAETNRQSEIRSNTESTSNVNETAQEESQ
jgi:putative ABC transport system ATP-binding protein